MIRRKVLMVTYEDVHCIFFFFDDNVVVLCSRSKSMPGQDVEVRKRMFRGISCQIRCSLIQYSDRLETSLNKPQVDRFGVKYNLLGEIVLYSTCIGFDQKSGESGVLRRLQNFNSYVLTAMQNREICKTQDLVRSFNSVCPCGFTEVNSSLLGWTWILPDICASSGVNHVLLHQG